MPTLKIPAWLIKTIAFLLAAATPFLVFATGVFVPLKNDDADAVLRMTDGFMRGMCHVEMNDNDMNDALDMNVEWVREDILLPLNSDGAVNDKFVYWTKYFLSLYKQKGFKILAVTPGITDFLSAGIDPRTDEGKKTVRETARFIAEEYAGIYADAIQVANEIGVDRFTAPLTTEEGAEFIGIQLEEMDAICDSKKVPLSYNLGGMGILQLPKYMKPYNKYVDFVGADIYVGSFEPIVHDIDANFVILNYCRSVTKKPIVITEFGYIGLGEPKTDEEKKEVLKEYGFESEDEARKDIDTLISRLPETMRDNFIKLHGDESDEEKGNQMFNGEYSNHLYRELSDGIELKGYRHTPVGEARFFRYLIPRFAEYKYVVGEFVYELRDADKCYFCGQENCPVETGWGMVDGDGNRKPSFYAVQEEYAKIKESGR
ncbi:MAG: hypothetical protein K6F09_06135 [Clostridiales bacterium]|nr:hypothetical protein [Clostridiales bacterium]